jgi:dTDP-4-dehydrorhamnose 3,5-epimerase
MDPIVPPQAAPSGQRPGSVDVGVAERAVVGTAIDGLVVISLKQIGDERGTVREFFRSSDDSWGPWQQVNVTETQRGGLRGLHGEDMTKLVGVVAGEAFGAYVDARPSSPTRGAVVTVPLTIGTQVLVPAGVCNGFQALADGTQYLYCFDAEWVPGMAGVAVHPLDPALGIDWPLPVDPDDRAQLSAKDAAQPTLAEVLGS